MPALDSIEVEGYKSIRSTEIAVGAINVLIGANGSGKSNLVGVFCLLADLADRRLQLHIARQGGADAILHFGRKKTSSLRISLRSGRHGYEAALVPSAGDTLVFERESDLAWPSTPVAVPGPVPGYRPTIHQHLSPGGSRETAVYDARPDAEDFGARPIITEL